VSEKLTKSTCVVLIGACTFEAGVMVWHDYKHNVECRPPVNQAGCLPTAPDYLLTPHVEAHTSSAAAGFSPVTAFTMSPPNGITGHARITEAPDRSA
jgi:hypothetical protein